MVDLHGNVRILQRIDLDKAIHLAAGDKRLHKPLQPIFQKAVASRHLRAEFEITVIDAFHLNGDLHPVDHIFGAPVARHAFHHSILL